MRAAATLAEATRVLEGDHPQRSRMAAWLARSALERAVRDSLTGHGLEPGEASMRSLLTCLGRVDDAMGGRAEYAWAQLSSACHHHAYELAPTVTEVRGWIEQVHVISEGSGQTRG